MLKPTLKELRRLFPAYTWAVGEELGDYGKQKYYDGFSRAAGWHISIVRRYDCFVRKGQLNWYVYETVGGSCLERTLYKDWLPKQPVRNLNKRTER